jgi:radical SAM protein with 4Fe4S-binding SPASM domain
MSVENFETVINKIKGHTEYIYLHLLGEPLMHPNLDEILGIAYKNNIKVNITTNGHLLKDKLDTINNSKSIRQMNISLHSFNNIADIKSLLDTVDSIKIDCYISLRLWNLGVENNNNEIIKIISDHYKVEIDNIGENIKLKDKVYLDFEYEFKWPDINDEVRSNCGTCYGLRTHIGILVDGTVVPCCLDTDGIINLGNIFENDLDTILNSNRVKQIKESFLNRKLTESLCQRCHYITRFEKNNKIGEKC